MMALLTDRFPRVNICLIGKHAESTRGNNRRLTLSTARGLRSVAWRTAWLETLATDQRASAYLAEEEEAVSHGRMSKGKP
ncbi:unnamed protein product [Lampetra planeri]